MPNVPTIGVFIPGYLNTCNSSSASGQGDVYGNVYPSGLTPGKVIELGASEARGLAAPGTTLYDGAYQWIQLDSGATAANATNGLAAYIKIPATPYETPTVTTADQATATTNLLAGVFINPATVNGVANGPTPGNWCFIFVGAGRATVQYGTVVTGGATGMVIPSGTSGLWTDIAAAASVIPTGTPFGTAPTASTPGVAYFSEIFYRIAGQGV